MTETVNVHEAKTHLSRLLVRVSKGEEIVIARAGKPVARLVPLANAVVRRTPGSAAGLVRMSDDFDRPLPEDLIAQYEVEILW